MRALKTAILLSAFAAATPAFAAPADILDANKSASHGDAWDNLVTLEADYAYSGQGLTGTQHSISDIKSGRFVDTDAIGPINVANGFDGAHAWAKDQSGTITEQDGGDNRQLAVNEAYRRANLWWRADRGGAAITDDGTKSDAGVSYDVLTVTPRDGKPFDAWFDAHSHLLARVVEQQATLLTTSTYADYSPVAGALVAHKIAINQGDHKYDQTLTLTAAKFAPKQSAETYAMPKTKVADFSIAGGAAETTFPFQLINNHIYADVSVDGKGPYLFIFDTGGVNLITPPVARELGLRTEGRMQGNGAGSGHVDVGLAKVDSLTLGNAMVKSQVFAVLPLNALSNIEGLDEQGMVGFETFRRFVTRIDYGARTITLIAPTAFDAKDAGTPVPITFNGNTIEVEASYDGRRGNFTVDTGARSSLTLTTPFVAANNLRTDAIKGVEGVTGWGVGGPTRAFAMRGRELDLGPARLENTVVELSTDKAGGMADAAIAGNIGAGILKRFVITLDYDHSTMYLKPVTTPIDDLDTFDRAGLWINASDAGFKIVDVMQGAPAAEAGLKAGDEIVAIDGKPASELKLYDVRKDWRDEAPGTVVKLTIKRATETREVPVTLRDLI